MALVRRFALLAAILFAVELHEGTCSSASSYSLAMSTGRTPGTQQQQQETKKDGKTSTATPSSPVAHMASGRACGIYIWDAPSALLSRWCNHLQKDSIYEGRGGKKFVRIEPGSMLQLLYPCSRYSADRCMICGGKFRDHLALWWSKHLYTPFDMYVDQVYKDGVVWLNDAKNASSKRGGNNRNKSIHQSTQTNPEYAFHRRYVLDLSHLLRGVEDEGQKKRMVKQSIGNMFPRVRDNDYNVEIHNAVPYSKGEPPISFAIPAVDLRRIPTAGRAITLITLRELLLNGVESIMELEGLDEARARSRS